MKSATLKLKESDPRDRRKKSLFREYGESLVIAFILALIIKFFLIQAFSIPSGSMEKTLLIGDYLLVNKLSYGIRNPFTNRVVIPIGQPERGDVVVFIFPQDPSKDYIKRVIGLPGDKIQIINKKVSINGKVLRNSPGPLRRLLGNSYSQESHRVRPGQLRPGGGPTQLLFLHGG